MNNTLVGLLGILALPIIILVVWPAVASLIIGLVLAAAGFVFLVDGVWNGKGVGLGSLAVIAVGITLIVVGIIFT